MVGILEGTLVKILLVQLDYSGGDVSFRLAALPEPLALEMVAACAPGHEYRIVDVRLGDDLGKALEEFLPDLVAVTALTPEVYAACDALRQAKTVCPGAVTVVGGYHATLVSEDFFLPFVDVVAPGECELIFPPLLRALAAGGDLAGVAGLIWRRGAEFVRNPPLNCSELDIDAVPLPRRDLVARHRHAYSFLFSRPDTSMVTSRGCPYRCNFCSVWQFYGGRTRQMSPERVLAELRIMEAEHVTFVDDNFLLNWRREKEIAERIRAEGIHMAYGMECRTDSIVRHPEVVELWVDIGLSCTLLGLEGASDSVLQNVSKSNSLKINDEAIRILRSHGVAIWGAFLVDPDWTEDDFKRLKDYVADRQITHTQFTVLTPLPGTDLYEQRRSELLTTDYRCFDTMHAVLPTRLSRERFYECFADLFRQVNIEPYYDLLQRGRITIAEMKRGKRMLDAASQAEAYHLHDPILGRRTAVGRE